MKDLFDKMLDHPLTTIIIIGSIGRAAIGVINACKGIETKPIVSILVKEKES